MSGKCKFNSEKILCRSIYILLKLISVFIARHFHIIIRYYLQQKRNEHCLFILLISLILNNEIAI